MEDNFAIAAITRNDTAYPVSLAQLPDAPAALYVRGNFRPAPLVIALVGTRKASPASVATARRIAGELARQECIIVSGLALGIDAAAHEGALEGGGITWAVCATGLDTIYPAQHRGLAQRILTHDGCLISEYPPRTPSLPYHFIQRNRIISALAQAVVIVEAPRDSGALSTASFAQTLKKPVLVLPGPATADSFAGSHELIRSGARLVSSAADILADLGVSVPDRQPSASPVTQNASQKKIVDALRPASTPLSLDSIAEMTTLSARDVSAHCAALVLEGIIEEIGGNKYRLRR